MGTTRTWNGFVFRSKLALIAFALGAGFVGDVGVRVNVTLPDTGVALLPDFAW